MKKYKVTLTAEERNSLQGLIAAKKTAAKKVIHARILLKADAGPGGPSWTDARIAEALECTVNSLENEADRITRDAIARLFENEKDPIVLIKWKEIYESLEAGTDRCEDVANVLERILLKHV